MIGEVRVNPDALTGRHKMRKDKAERMESVLEGREDRSYGAAAGRRKQKTGECFPPFIAALQVACVAITICMSWCLQHVMGAVQS